MSIHHPYVVSQDIHILLAQWAQERGFQIPNQKFFDQLRQTYAKMMIQLLPNFIYLTADELQKNLHQMVEKAGVKPVSLDRVYFPSQLNLSLTRTVDQHFQDLGISQRAGEAPLEKQLQKVVASGIKEIALIDDVIFTGGLISKVRNRLQEIGIRVPLVYTAVGVGQGVNRLEVEGLEVHCVRYYSEVIDQVCERDFFLGVPSCGRTLVDTDSLIWGVPYIKPFGDPNWASIPEKDQVEYSLFCIAQSVKLWEAIEQASNRPVLCRDLSRPMVGFPINGERFVDLLRKHL